MTKKRKLVLAKPRVRADLHWTQTHEAIAFISAAVGEAFCTADATGLAWGALATPDPETGELGYPVMLEIGKDPTQVDRIIVSFMAVLGDHAAFMKLYAIIGWARQHDIAVETD